MNGTSDLPGQTGTSPNTHFTLPQIVLRSGISTLVQAVLLFYVKYVAEREGASDAIMATIFITAIFALLPGSRAT